MSAAGRLPPATFPKTSGRPRRGCSSPASAAAIALDDGVRGALRRGLGLREIGALAAEAAIRIAVDDEGGNLQRAAHRLRVTDRALQLRRAQRASTAQ